MRVGVEEEEEQNMAGLGEEEGGKWVEETPSQFPIHLPKAPTHTNKF